MPCEGTSLARAAYPLHAQASIGREMQNFIFWRADAKAHIEPEAASSERQNMLRPVA